MTEVAENCNTELVDYHMVAVADTLTIAPTNVKSLFCFLLNFIEVKFNSFYLMKRLLHKTSIQTISIFVIFWSYLVKLFSIFVCTCPVFLNFRFSGPGTIHKLYHVFMYGSERGHTDLRTGERHPIIAHKNLVDNFTTLFFVEIKFNCHKCEI